GVSGFLVDGADPDDLVRVVREELAAALPRLDAIGRAAARRIRELGEPQRYVQAIEALVAAHRPAACAPAVAERRSLVSVIVPYHREDPQIVGEAVDSAL